MMGGDMNAGEAVCADVFANGGGAAAAKAAMPEGSEVGVVCIVKVNRVGDVE